MNCHKLNHGIENENTIEVYYFHQDDFIHLLESFKKVLSDKELERAEKFRHESGRNHFIVCHGILRYILSQYANKRPDHLNILTDSNDKPFLVHKEIFFNLSHTRNMAAIAISRKSEIGIDIELIRENKHITNIAKRYYSESEKKLIEHSGQQLHEFFLIWTRKEAFLKALGLGIRTRLNTIDLGQTQNTILFDSVRAVPEKNIHSEYHIYSEIVNGHLLSVASPDHTGISMIQYSPEFMIEGS